MGATDPKFNKTSLVPIYSSGKNLASIVFAFMREQGLVEYTEKVTKYWPEFGQNGKDKLTVANVMKHEAGLNRLKTMIGPEDLTTEAIK